MSCIPKRQGKIRVKDLRPLTIAPVAYRLFCKTLLALHESCQSNVPANSIGGVKGRSGHSAWLPATIHCEATWRKVVDARRALQGVAIDTEKFFDNIQQSDACEALRYIGIPTDVIQSWQFMIQRIKRFASFNGAIATVGFCSAKGLPQGDPLSMLAAAAFLGKWTSEMPNQDLLAKVFVDDRLLLGFCNESLIHAFHTTEFWDTHHGFSTHAKTTAFGTNDPQHNLWWMDGYEVKRDCTVVYLGVPLPFEKMRAAKFFEPLLQQCVISLNKVIRAKLTHENATTIIARKIIPMLCYAASVVRPTKAQISSIRTKIFEAASNRRCQTQLAHTIFCEKAHLFDPEVAMIYHNLRFWRKIYVEHPEFVELLNDTVDHIAPCKHSLFGPVTLLLADVSWLGCGINTKDGIIIRQDQTHLPFKSLDKKEFLHEIRQLIRNKLLSDLSSKHPKWDGVQNANLDITCKLLRKMDTSCTYRVPLIRLLTDAHATPDRLFKMGIKTTPHCPYCLHEHGDIEHIVWDCPRFRMLRADWDPALLDRSSWPACAKHALIFTDDMNASIKDNWHVFQIQVSQLLSQWMEFNRHPELYEQFAPGSSLPAQEIQASNVPCMVQNSIARQCEPLPLDWRPPASRTAINQWGSALTDYSLIVQFWARCTMHPHPKATKIRTWSHALAIFIQNGGHLSAFLYDCQFMGMAAYKFRLLSRKLLEDQDFWDDLPDIENDAAEKIRWLPTFPKESAFPSNVFYTPQWNLVDAAMRLQRIFIEHKIDEQVNTHVLRITPADFCAAFTDKQPIFKNEMISKNWALPRLFSKSRPPPWIALVNELKANRIPPDMKITCITQLSLEKWNSMTAQEIRSALPTRPGPLKRFRAAINRITRFQDALERFKANQTLENNCRTHILAPNWAQTERCASCNAPINFSCEPRKLTRKCTKPKDFPVQILDSWSQSYEVMLRLLQSICSKL